MIVRELLPDDARAAGVQTLVDLLEYRAARQPSHIVFRFINGDGREEEELTFATLQRRTVGLIHGALQHGDGRAAPSRVYTRRVIDGLPQPDTGE